MILHDHLSPMRTPRPRLWQATILEATDIPAPDMVNGIKQKPIEGVSMAYTFDSANGNAPPKRNTQFFEML
jgi:arylsulfatase A-like enzyme